MPDAAEQTKEQLDAEWPHLCDVLRMQRVPAAMAELMKQDMILAAAKLGVNIEAEDEYERRSARRMALLEIFAAYGGRDRGA